MKAPVAQPTVVEDRLRTLEIRVLGLTIAGVCLLWYTVWLTNTIVRTTDERLDVAFDYIADHANSINRLVHERKGLAEMAEFADRLRFGDKAMAESIARKKELESILESTMDLEAPAERSGNPVEGAGKKEL